MRPGEIVRLRAEDLDWSMLQIQVRAGKSQAARRTLPMTGNVYRALSAHYERLGSPEEGWIFHRQMTQQNTSAKNVSSTGMKRPSNDSFDEKMSDPMMKRTYVAQAREPWRTIIILRDETGLRVADMVRLRHSDIHLSKRGVEIVRSEKRIRKIKLSNPAVKVLRILSAIEPENRRNGSFPATNPAKHVHRKRVRDWHAQTLKRMPGAFVPYVMRHTALTRLANSEGVSLTTVAAAAGHSSIAVTQRYVHPQKNDIRKAFELKTGERIGDARRREVLRPVEDTDRTGDKIGDND